MPGGREVVAAAELPHHRMTRSFDSFGLRGLPDFSIDPFLNLDEFRMSQPTFPPHPHAGFSAVTYLFEDSPGSFTNRDSLGDHRPITPGSLHWTQAARGMMHEETPRIPGVTCHGLQMFVNLRADHKHAAPRAFHVEAADIPEVTWTGARVHVLAGNFAGRHSPLTELLTPILFLDVHLDAGTRVAIPVPETDMAFGMVIGGVGYTGSELQSPLSAHTAVGFSGGERIELAAGGAALHLLIGAARPLGERVVFGGPFAMTSEEELAAARARFERGEMGQLAPSFF